VIDLGRIAGAQLRSEPYEWAEIDGLFAPADARALADTYPRDHFKRVSAYGGEKDYDYEARALIGMGASTVAFREHLSVAWQRLADDLLSRGYRDAFSALTKRDLGDALMEVNVFHYGPGSSLGPHPDLADKVVTHVLYFNDAWNDADGGCLTILRSNDAGSAYATVSPVVGNSAVLVRSENSWHAVAPVRKDCPLSRRSMTVTFYRPGSKSTMWPAGQRARLHTYGERRPWWKFW
jgi:hypothetical protein